MSNGGFNALVGLALILQRKNIHNGLHRRYSLEPGTLAVEEMTFKNPESATGLPMDPKLNSHHFTKTGKIESMKLGVAALAFGMCVAAFGQQPTIVATSLS